MKFLKRKTPFDLQIKKLEEEDLAEVEVGTDQYYGLMEVLTDLKLKQTEDLVKQNEMLTTKVKAVCTVLGVVISAIGSIAVPIILAKVAYTEENDMKIKNGTVWNLIGKKF
jgi:uncharacterized protein YjbK